MGYWAQGWEAPSTYTINLSCRFVALAHSVGGTLMKPLSGRLGDVRFAPRTAPRRRNDPEEPRFDRCVLTDEVWSRVTKLPEQLLRQARPGAAARAPSGPAVLAQIAVAVAILTVGGRSGWVTLPAFALGEKT